MNKLTASRRAEVVKALIDGCSIRAISRMTGTDSKTILRLLVEVGEFCSGYQDAAFRNLNTRRVEADEVWSYVGSKGRRSTKREGHGDLWTWTAIDAESKAIFSFLVGQRSAESCHAFMHDVAGRLRNRVQLTTDGLSLYWTAVEKAFGYNGCDFGVLDKQYGVDQTKPTWFGQSSKCIGANKVVKMGNPDIDLISTSYVERSNLELRTKNRRFTRLTNAFSKKAENHAASVSLHFFAYNFVRAHGTLTKANRGIKKTPAMAAGVTNHVWTVEELLSKMETDYLIAVA
jgi:IS1 family transposase